MGRREAVEAHLAEQNFEGKRGGMKCSEGIKLHLRSRKAVEARIFELYNVAKVHSHRFSEPCLYHESSNFFSPTLEAMPNRGFSALTYPTF